MATGFSRGLKNVHIRFNRLGDTQAQSDLFWPISWINRIGGLRSIFNSLYHQCQSSSAQLCPIHLAHSAVGWQSFERFFWQTVRLWRSVPFLLLGLKSPLLMCSHSSFLLARLLVCLTMFGLVRSPGDSKFWLKEEKHSSLNMDFCFCEFSLHTLTLLYILML